MLFLIQSDGTQLDLGCDNYAITHCYNGEEDKLSFTLPRGHALCAKLKEQARIRETTEERIFSLSSVSLGGGTMSYSAELDLSGLQEKLLLSWASTASDMLGAIRQVLPSGWTAASEVPSTPVPASVCSSFHRPSKVSAADFLTCSATFTVPSAATVLTRSMVTRAPSTTSS